MIIVAIVIAIFMMIAYFALFQKRAIAPIGPVKAPESQVETVNETDKTIQNAQ